MKHEGIHEGHVSGSADNFYNPSLGFCFDLFRQLVHIQSLRFRIPQNAGRNVMGSQSHGSTPITWIDVRKQING